jgi:uncharacterized membrane protein YqhA
MNRILAATRYAVVIPAIASILGALLLMVQGSIEMIQVIIDAALNGTKLKITIVDVLTAVDAILLGTVLLVIGYGLYELFIDVNRSQDVIAFGVGAGALVTGLAVFAFATKKDPSMKVSRKDFGSKKP